ncbi:MAG: hypothetical protein Ct9H300mP1_34390 [Planctomycetaceae bacterium]|nr:MAG: hypothetical protein Ct9H300mP1_34390 [Planctomycetaceae bacterium]
MRGIVEQAAKHDCAIRVGVNWVRSTLTRSNATPGRLDLADARQRVGALRIPRLADFTNYCVSLKDSDPQKVIEVNRRFAEQRPDVPLHLGVTEAGCHPTG